MANSQESPRPSRKKKKSIHIELSILGLLGLGVVIFIILLWMFLLGIWAGQTILLPEGGGDTVSSPDSSGLPPEGGAAPKLQASPAPVARAAQPVTPIQAPIIEAPIQIPIETPTPVETPSATPAPNEEAMALSPEADTESSPSSPASFFSLQVAAFSEAEQADKEAAAWRQRGTEAFSLRPEEGGDGLYRVCIGRFAELAQANKEASRLEEAESIKTFITMVPVERAGQP